MNLLGSKIYVFGGQVEGFFFNDLLAFDLNAMNNPGNKWEFLLRNSHDDGPPVGQVPPARTNHTMVTFNDKLYLYVILFFTAYSITAMLTRTIDSEVLMESNGLTMSGRMIPEETPGRKLTMLGLLQLREKAMPLP